MRIGHGYDVHRLVSDRALVLGGVRIDYAFGLDGHSDADVLAHAVIDALLGAAGLPDIGELFPDTRGEYRGISSMELLARTGKLLAEASYAVINIDATVIAQSPKLSPYKQAMRENMARALVIDPRKINVKATTEEGLGFTGRGEGVAAHALCLIDENKPG